MRTLLVILALLAAGIALRGRTVPPEPSVHVEDGTHVYQPVVRGSLLSLADSVTTWPRVDFVREGESIPVTMIVWFDGLPTACVPLEQGGRGWAIVELRADSSVVVRDPPRTAFDPACGVDWPE